MQGGNTTVLKEQWCYAGLVSWDESDDGLRLGLLIYSPVAG